MMDMSFARIVICLVGAIDMGLTMCTFCGVTTILDFRVPHGAYEIFHIPSLDSWWLGLTGVICALLWLTSALLAHFSITGQLDEFGRLAYGPWFFTGLGAMLLSLYANLLEGDTKMAGVIVFFRILQIVIVWAALGRWEWEAFQLDFSYEEDKDIYAPPIPVYLKDRSDDEYSDDDQDR